jgi:hypothetical protein
LLCLTGKMKLIYSTNTHQDAFLKDCVYELYKCVANPISNPTPSIVTLSRDNINISKQIFVAVFYWLVFGRYTYQISENFPIV